MAELPIVERLQEESERLSRLAFDGVDAGIQANLVDHATDLIRELVEALERSERKLTAYVGVCKDDKEFHTILEMSRVVLAKAKEQVR